MEITLQGIISKETREQARNRNIFPYFICGVDVYLAPEIAHKDNVVIDKTRKWKNSRLYLSDRHYKIFHLLDPDEDNPQTTIEDVKNKSIRYKRYRIFTTKSRNL